MDNDQKQPLLRTSSVPQDGPPAYDYGTEQTPDKPLQASSVSHESTQVLVIRQNPVGPSGQYTMQPSPLPMPTVFNYVNARTGETIVSLLPPHHPEMICLQSGSHERETQYGFLGLLAAIVWFPLGIGLCLLDRRVKCKRCGVMIEDGICS